MSKHRDEDCDSEFPGEKQNLIVLSGGPIVAFPSTLNQVLVTGKNWQKYLRRSFCPDPLNDGDVRSFPFFISSVITVHYF